MKEKARMRRTLTINYGSFKVTLINFGYSKLFISLNHFSLIINTTPEELIDLIIQSKISIAYHIHAIDNTHLESFLSDETRPTIGLDELTREQFYQRLTTINSSELYITTSGMNKISNSILSPEQNKTFTEFFFRYCQTYLIEILQDRVGMLILDQSIKSHMHVEERLKQEIIALKGRVNKIENKHPELLLEFGYKKPTKKDFEICKWLSKSGISQISEVAKYFNIKNKTMKNRILKINTTWGECISLVDYQKGIYQHSKEECKVVVLGNWLYSKQIS